MPRGTPAHAIRRGVRDRWTSPSREDEVLKEFVRQGAVQCPERLVDVHELGAVTQRRVCRPQAVPRVDLVPLQRDGLPQGGDGFGGLVTRLQGVSETAPRPRLVGRGSDRSDGDADVQSPESDGPLTDERMLARL
jgi:hypothetical protein